MLYVIDKKNTKPKHPKTDQVNKQDSDEKTGKDGVTYECQKTNFCSG